jgi:proline iminopeptidase
MTGHLSDPLSQGTHSLSVHERMQQYHVYGSGPVCVLQPGGPGILWDCMRMPAVEERMTVVYVEALGTGASDRLPTHPNGYTRSLYAEALGHLIDHLEQERVYLIGHSYGGFVAQRYALDHPDRLSGLILYESAAVTGEEHGAEAARQVAAFATRNVDNPELPGVLEALQAVGGITKDAELTAALRGLLPAYVADYWGREAELAPMRETIQVTYISSLDEYLAPDIIDDRAALLELTVPTLVIVGRYDVICGVRWAEELHHLIPKSRLLILERSGHLGHVEEPTEFASGIIEFVESVSTA